MVFRKLLNMALRFIKTDPISELTDEIKELKMRIQNLEQNHAAVETQVFIRPTEDRTAIFSPPELVFEEDEIPFLPKPKFWRYLYIVSLPNNPATQVIATLSEFSKT